MNNLETFLSNCCQVALWIKNQRKIIFSPIHTRGQVRQRGTVTTSFLPLWSLMRISSREPQREQLCMEYNHCTGLSGCWCTFSTSKTMAYETCYFYIISFPSLSFSSPSFPLYVPVSIYFIYCLFLDFCGILMGPVYCFCRMLFINNFLGYFWFYLTLSPAIPNSRYCKFWSSYGTCRIKWVDISNSRKIDKDSMI